MADVPTAPATPAADLPPLPTQTCPHCSNMTPVGSYCGVCGAHLVHPVTALASRRPHAFSASPEEPVVRLSVISTLFPHLSYRSSTPFRAGFTLLVALLVIFSATGLEAPVIALAAIGVPLLFQLYIWEVDIYEKDHLRLAAITLIVGAGLGVGWALLGGHIVTIALQPSLFYSLSSWANIKAAVFVPIVGQALMLVPLLAVFVVVPGFGGRRESLDGFTLGAAGALGFSFAAILTDLTSRLSDGLAPSRPFTSILTEALIRGIAMPVLFAAATGLIGASLWVRRAERGTTGPGARWLTNPALVVVALLALEVGLGFADQARLGDIPLLIVHLIGTALALMALRVGIHHILLHEQHDVGIGPAMTCPQCNHVVPRMPFCPSCGVAQVATTKRHRRQVPAAVPAGEEVDELGAPVFEKGPGGWPVLATGTVAATGWSSYPMAAAPPARTQRGHHSLIVGLFSVGIAAVVVALLLTALVREPDTTPVPRCHEGICPGLAVQTEAPLPAPIPLWHSPDGHFSFAPFGNRLWGGLQISQGPSYYHVEMSGVTGTLGNGKKFSLSGGSLEIADITGASGATAEKVVDAVMNQNASSATLAYPMSDPLVGGVYGYGGVYDDTVNSGDGQQVEYRLLVMGAIQNGVAVVVFAASPYDASFQSLPLLAHPSFIDMDIAVNGVLDYVINSIQWTASTFQ